MEKTIITFFGTERSNTEQHELKAHFNSNNEIFISIQGNSLDYICLNKPTAVRLVRELKRQIAYLSNESENE